MICNGKTCIASKRNTKGILVYIPETIRISGSTSIQGYVFGSSRLSTSVPRVLFSSDQSLVLGLKWDSKSVTIKFPFSYQMLLDILSGKIKVESKVVKK